MSMSQLSTNFFYSHRSLLQYAKNPVNMLFLELIMFHKDKDIILRSDDPISPLIYQILQNNADAVEIVHTREWEKYFFSLCLLFQ
jgi:hypothetical protein